jgi:hypothetical protein
VGAKGASPESNARKYEKRSNDIFLYLRALLSGGVTTARVSVLEFPWCLTS